MNDLFTHITPADAFDGATYEPKRDHVRLRGHLLRVYELMRSGNWYALAYIADRVGCSEASASARLRDLRKSKYGGHTIEREHVGNGLYRYRLKLNSAPVSVGPPNAGSLKGAGTSAGLIGHANSEG